MGHSVTAVSRLKNTRLVSQDTRGIMYGYPDPSNIITFLAWGCICLYRINIDFLFLQETVVSLAFDEIRRLAILH